MRRIAKSAASDEAVSARAINAGPDDYQVILLRVDIQGQTCREAAEILAAPVDAVTSRHRRRRGKTDKELFSFGKRHDDLSHFPCVLIANDAETRCLRPSSTGGARFRAFQVRGWSSRSSRFSCRSTATRPVRGARPQAQIGGVPPI